MIACPPYCRYSPFGTALVYGIVRRAFFDEFSKSWNEHYSGVVYDVLPDGWGVQKGENAAWETFLTD